MAGNTPHLDSSSRGIPKNRTLLFVDDDPGVLSALRRLFRFNGYTVLVASSGAEGLRLLECGNVDLVISDMRMPVMDGASFLKQVRTGWPGVVRILLTGYADATSMAKAIDEGEIHHCIDKPWRDDYLLSLVGRTLECIEP